MDKNVQIPNLDNASREDLLALISALQSQNAELNSQNSILQKQIKLQQDVIETTKETLADTNRRLDKTKSELTDVSKENKELHNEVSKLNKDVIRLHEKIENMSELADNRDKEHHRLMEELNNKIDSLVVAIGNMNKSQSLEAIQTLTQDNIKELLNVEEADVYFVDPYNKNLFYYDEYHKEQYLDYGKTSLIADAVNNYKDIKGSIVDNNYTHNLRNIGDNKSANNIDNVAVTPIKNNKGELIALSVAKNRAEGFDPELNNYDDTFKVVSQFSKMCIDNARVKILSYTDKLTRIDNRNAISSLLQGRIYDDLQKGIPVAAFQIDIDKFKTFNDTYGHNVGDKVLKNVAEIMKENCRRSTDICVSTATRWGGEEFIVFIEGREGQTQKEVEIAALRQAEKLRGEIGSIPVDAGNGKTVQVTISAGVAAMDAEIYKNKTPEETEKVFTQVTYQKLDELLYRAKNNGRNRTEADIDLMNEYQNEIDTNLEVITADVDMNYKNLTTPLLASNREVAKIEAYHKDADLRSETTLRIVGSPEVRYNDEIYTDPEAYPKELTDKLKTYNYDGVSVLNENNIELEVKLYDKNDNIVFERSDVQRFYAKGEQGHNNDLSIYYPDEFKDRLIKDTKLYVQSYIKEQNKEQNNPEHTNDNKSRKENDKSDRER